MPSLLGLASAVAAVILPTLPNAVPSAAETGPASGVWPLAGRPAVVARFDPPSETWGRGHRGVDLAGHVGQAVRSAQAGTVSFAGRIAGRGVVVVNHGATRTTYEPVHASVRVGDAIGPGGHLGRLEWFGTHCLPAACLHWGRLQGDKYLDPLGLVGGPRPVRLFPSGSDEPAWSPLGVRIPESPVEVFEAPQIGTPFGRLLSVPWG